MLLYTELVFQDSEVRGRVSIETCFSNPKSYHSTFEAHYYHCYLSPLFAFSQHNLKILKIEGICSCYSSYPEFCSSYAYVNLTNIYWIFIACQTVSRYTQYSSEQETKSLKEIAF